jgi:hypothetical protein
MKPLRKDIISCIIFFLFFLQIVAIYRQANTDLVWIITLGMVILVVFDSTMDGKEKKKHEG